MKLKTSISCGVALLGLSTLAMGGDPKAPIVAPVADPCPWTFEAAILLLEADSEDSDGYEDQSFETGYRFSLAYQEQGNLGYRVRYFDFEGTNGNSDEVGPDIFSIDLELFNSFALGSWEGEWSVGLRYFDLYEWYDGGADVDYAGIGPVVGVELTRDLNKNWSFYVNARASYLFGEDDADEAADDTPTLEGGLGIQRNLNIGNCGGYVRLGLEAHQWYELAYDSTDGEAFGGALAFGFNF